MMQTAFDPQEAKPLTPTEKEMLATLRMALHFKGDSYFTSDTFRMLGLDKFLQDPKHEIGYFFLKLKQHGIAETTGKSMCSKLPSNHGHRIQQWRLKQ